MSKEAVHQHNRFLHLIAFFRLMWSSASSCPTLFRTKRICLPERYRAESLGFYPTLPRCHPNSWKWNYRPTANGTVSPLQPIRGMISVIVPRLEGHSVRFLDIQTHPSYRFLLAVDS
jgi:hypothetical protein